MVLNAAYRLTNKFWANQHSGYCGAAAFWWAACFWPSFKQKGSMENLSNPVHSFIEEEGLRILKHEWISYAIFFLGYCQPIQLWNQSFLDILQGGGSSNPRHMCIQYFQGNGYTTTHFPKIGILVPLKCFGQFL